MYLEHAHRWYNCYAYMSLFQSPCCQILRTHEVSVASKFGNCWQNPTGTVEELHANPETRIVPDQSCKPTPVGCWKGDGRSALWTPLQIASLPPVESKGRKQRRRAIFHQCILQHETESVLSGLKLLMHCNVSKPLKKTTYCWRHEPRTRPTCLRRSLIWGNHAPMHVRAYDVDISWQNMTKHGLLQQISPLDSKT